jgi:hypothetical protein
MNEQIALDVNSVVTYRSGILNHFHKQSVFNFAGSQEPYLA